MSGPASITGRVKPCWAQMAAAGAQRREVGLPVEISYKSVNDALRRLMKACRSPRHSEWGERRFAQALLDASLWCFPPTGAGVLDSTDISTWARVRHRKPLVDADPDSPPPPDHPLAPPDPNHPHARRRGHHLPDAPVGADGRYVYTIDIDARMGWRSPELEERCSSAGSISMSSPMLCRRPANYRWCTSRGR